MGRSSGSLEDSMKAGIASLMTRLWGVLAVVGLSTVLTSGCLQAPEFETGNDIPPNDVLSSDDSGEDGETSACQGCVVDDTCVPLGSTCPDSTPGDCFAPRCVESGGACADVRLDAGETCGEAPCTGVCNDEGSCLPSGGICGEANYAFVTSMPAPLTSGLETLDDFCLERATAAGLSGTRWRAWAATQDATLEERFGSAQGWQRIDGLPIAQTLDDLRQGNLWYPVLLNEFGVEPTDSYVATGLSLVAQPAANCQDFTGDGIVNVGHAGAGHFGLSYVGETSCDTPVSVACFDTSNEVQVQAPTPEQGRLIFVSQGTFTPGSGPQAAHALCQTEAENSGAPSGVYRALIEGDPGLVFPGGQPWVRADGLLVFNGGAEQVPNLLNAPPLAPLVPTGSDLDGYLSWVGSAQGDPCNGWTESSGTGPLVYAGFAHSKWLSDITTEAPCDTPAAVWCALVQPEVVQCDEDDCAIDGFCVPPGPVDGTDCLVCDTSVSKYILQPNDAACTPSAACAASTCEPQTGSCVEFPVNDGPCDDGDPCTLDDICVNDICAGQPQCEAHNLVFTTEQTYSADLSGLEGADAICQQAAIDAGLGGVFMAWIADADVGPLERLDTFYGGGSYARPDGAFVAGNLQGFAEGRIAYPPNQTASGSDAPQDSRVWSGVALGGEALKGTTCGSWSSSGVGTGAVGAVHSNAANAFDLGTAGCDEEHHLRCLQVDRGGTLSPPPEPDEHRHAFISPPTFAPMSGVAFADALCQKSAAAASLPVSVYKALLPTPGTLPALMESPADRFTTLGGVWVNSKGIPLFQNALDMLTDGTAPLVPLNLNAAGNPVDGDVRVTVAPGGLNALSDSYAACSSWNGPGEKVTVLPGLAKPTWYNTQPNASCEETDAVFCLEDSPANLVFLTAGTYDGAFGGLQEADQVCTDEADVYGFEGTFLAMLSTADLGGFIVDRLTFEGTSGWVRMDYRPVAQSPEDWPQDTILHAPVFKIDGQPVDVDALMWTGLNNGNTPSDIDCEGWTSNQVTATGRVGWAGAGGSRLGFAGNSGCHQPRHLLCLGIGAQATVEVPQVTGRIAFQSSGNFVSGGGLAAADALCVAEATDAGLSQPAKFKALLATDMDSAISRFSLTKPTWVRPDGVPIAASAEALANPLRALLAGITQHADGTPAGNGKVYTGAASTAAVGTETCQGWTATTGQANTTYSGAATLGWFHDGNNRACDPASGGSPVICLQD